MTKLPFFHKAKIGGIRFEEGVKLSPIIGLYVYSFAVILIFIIIVLRLFQLTVVKGNYYRRLAEQNRLRELIIEPQRGILADRKGFIIASNLVADIGKNGDRLLSKRQYKEPEALAHLVGYRQLADQSDLKNDSCLNKLKAGDKTGKKGLEKLFECDLRGKQGKKLIEIDAKGTYLKTIAVIPPENGKYLQLSIDLELQRKAYELIHNKKAAIIGLKPNTGEVLIFASSPSFNPQSFEDNTESSVNTYLHDEAKPLFNRITEGTYPPGSVIKPIIATAALEERKIDDKTLIEDTGTLKAGPLSFGNWYFLQYGKTEGMVDITKAIKRSNDIFFYKTGELLGPEKMTQWMEKFGFGNKTGIGFEEAEGTIPSPFWKKETIKDQWYLGDSYNLSIGQGYLLVTPLQTAVATAAFANGGYLCQPALLKNQQPNCKKFPISPKTLSLIREGMKQACSLGGTGWPLFNFKPQTACKTGTAESHTKSGLPHAWFTVFAPIENPEIVLTILMEEAGQGSDIAGPLAKEILMTYFERSE